MGGGALALGFIAPSYSAESSDVDRLVGALLGQTPLIEDLQELTDEIGGRPTGSEANLRSVEWALTKFQEAGLAAWKEPFEMPMLWLERSAAARVTGAVNLTPRVAAMPYSVATPEQGLSAPLVDGGYGTPEDFERLGERAWGAFVLVETPILKDVPGLFREYAEAFEIEGRAFEAGVAGVVFMGSRPGNVLYRHNASRGLDNRHPMLVMERDVAARALRLLRGGKELNLWVRIALESGGPYQSFNVVAEIPGSLKPEEFVLIGAHLDSWGLGDGALDNGCNVSMVLDVARQMQRLGIRPRRTIRFVLFNGEEQVMFGSWSYTQRHAADLDRYVMASSYDIGSGRIVGFFTGGRPELVAAVDATLAPVRGLGPFEHADVPIVGTDNYDFMMQGVANLVANQESANYGPNYHARSDTFDKVDQRQLRLNAAIAAAVTYGFAQMEVGWTRHTREQVQHLVDTTDLADQMRIFGVLDEWQDGTRGRSE